MDRASTRSAAAPPSSAGPVTSAECAARRVSRSLRNRMTAGVPQSCPQAVRDRCRTLRWQRKGFPYVAHRRGFRDPMAPGHSEDIVVQAFCTDVKPPAERAEYWTEAVGRAFIPLEVRTRGE